MAKARRSRRTFIQQSRGGPSPAQKATYHQVTGVGRRRVTREFLGITSDEEDDIQRRITDLIDGVVRRQQ